MEFEITKSSKNDAEDIAGLLNAATLNLHSKGISQWTYPWNIKEIETDIEHIFIMNKNGSIAGTFSLKNNDATVFPAKKDSLYLYRIALLPEFQGKNMGSKIIEYVFNFKKTIYLDCWAGNSALKKFYLNAGFSYCGDFPEKDYMISVFKHEN